METRSNVPVAGRTLSRVYRYSTTPVMYAGRVSEGWGEFLGFAVSAYGAYVGGGNPVLRSATCATLEEAALALANPSTVFTVVGHSIG